MNIDIRNFMGLFPATGRQILDSNAATIANDCRIGSGEIRPLYMDRQDHVCPAGTKSFYLHQGTWLHYDDEGRRFVPGPVYGDNQKLYMSKADGGLTVYHNGAEHAVGVPQPTTAMTAAVQGQSSGTTLDTESRIYVYTWVNSLGEESAPSPASNLVNVDIGTTASQTVKLTGITSYSGSGDYFPVTAIRIYRLAVGNETSGYYFVDEIATGTATYDDTVEGADLGEELITTTWSTPSSNLKGLCSLPGGILAAFKDNEVWLSEANYPYAWPVGYMYTVEYPIIQLAACGRVLFVFTTGAVYRMAVDAPDATVPVAFETNAPCLSAACVVSMPSGVLFPSREGLYLAAADGSSCTLVSEGYYDQPSWLRLTPASSMGAWISGVLFFAHPDQDTGQTTIKLFDFYNKVLTASAVPVEAFSAIPEYNRLFYLRDGSIWEWEGDRTRRRLAEWQTKDFMLNNPANFSGFLLEANFPSADTAGEAFTLFVAAIQENDNELGGAMGALPCADIAMGGSVASLPVITGGYSAGAHIAVTFYADNKEVYTIGVGSHSPKPLPSGFQARKWAVRIVSDVDIRRLAFGQSLGELYYAAEE